MRSDGDVKSFFRQQKARSGAAAAAKPTGGVSKKAALPHQKQAAALLFHPTPGKIQSPGLIQIEHGSCAGAVRSPRIDRSVDLMLFVVPVAADHVDGADARRENEDRERKAREFDMDMRYGPCLGLTRAQRWHRAAALGLAPPSHALCSDDQPCLWEGRV
jgi:DNA polymerase delta subunit 4